MSESMGRDELRESLRDELGPVFDEALERAVDVYHDARVGHLIDDTEEPWHHVLVSLAGKVQQAALQRRIEMVESGFSPSGQKA